MLNLRKWLRDLLISHEPVVKENLVTQLNHLTIGTALPVSVIRDNKLKQLTFIATPAPSDTLALEVINPKSCKSWLG